MTKSDPVRVSKIKQTKTSTGKPGSYQVEMWHDGLHEHRVIKDRDYGVLINKMEAQEERWSEKWERERARRAAQAHNAASVEEAQKRTEEAEAQLLAAENILSATLQVNDAVDWEALKDKKPFRFKGQKSYTGVVFDHNGKPLKTKEPEPLAPAPTRGDARYLAKLTLLDHIFASRKVKKLEEAKKRYERDFYHWQIDREERVETVKNYDTQFEAAKTAYEQARQEFLERQQAANAKIDQLRDQYQKADPEAILENCELVLNASNYPDFISKDFVINYNPDNHILVVDYNLPPPSAIPALKKVSYVKTKDEMKESHITEVQHRKLYDSVLYQIALRTLHELYEADTVNAIDSIVFNGWVQDINPATGNAETACIMTVQADKATFVEINLANIDHKACFKKLKGVSASTLSGLTPVKPLLQLSTDDDRFIAGYEVTDGLDSSTNLAAMHWQDFEHLIREIFEKEFAGADGAEVKITQASADGGVDGVVFDPDPIRGGKIVIQAKRYTNTVGVSAVRDLYGTVMNEGAVKGILVTTSDYGPDAYSFVNDKPLALLNGSNLLHLLHKHGHEARIDIKEAKLTSKK